MKKTVLLSIVFVVGVLAISSCEDEKKKLTIENIEAKNHDGGTEVSLGGTIAVEFDAIAGDEANLDFYHIEIHDHPASGAVEDEYKIIDADFKDESTFAGLKNAKVHKHITVSDSANLGSYHVVIVVVDKAGNSVDTEDVDTHITVVE